MQFFVTQDLFLRGNRGFPFKHPSLFCAIGHIWLLLLLLLLYSLTEQGRWSSDDTCFYPRGAQFVSWLRHQLLWLCLQTKADTRSSTERVTNAVRWPTAWHLRFTVPYVLKVLFRGSSSLQKVPRTLRQRDGNAALSDSMPAYGRATGESSDVQYRDERNAL